MQSAAVFSEALHVLEPSVDFFAVASGCVWVKFSGEFLDVHLDFPFRIVVSRGEVPPVLFIMYHGRWLPSTKNSSRICKVFCIGEQCNGFFYGTAIVPSWV